MLKELLEKLKGQKKTPERKEPRFKLGDGFYWEFEQVYNRKVNVWLLKEDDPKFRRCIVDERGYIQNFPGFKRGDWEKKLDCPMKPVVCYRFWIGSYENGKALVEWTIQPDGRYFADEDGFGAEDCEEITLYSRLDQNGRFTEPFSTQGV